MNKEQIRIIDNEIEILANKSYDAKNELKIYLHGRIDGLKWVKENI